MRLLSANPAIRTLLRPGNHSGFTLIEVMVASSIGLLVIAGVMMFMSFSGTSLSGTTAQSLINGRAGYAIEFIQNRARLATCVSNDASGNVLTLGFDDDPNTDSDNDGKPYNDRDHFEQFKFIGVNGSTNTISTNRLVYISDTRNGAAKTIIPAGVHNLPGYNIFTVTNRVMAIIRFNLADGYSRDHYQGIDIQATAVSLNRPTSVNIVTILP
jgi:prepilin-type N-terminal cleavage/methylation domain-containing protein